MGWLTDPKLLTLHNEVWDAIYNSGTYPDWQKCCGILNGMSMPDMLDEIWRIKMTARLDHLAFFVPRATGVNIPRLRAAMGAVQDRPPGDLDALLRVLPDDQQFAITSVRAVTQAPDSLSPSLWSNYYWSTRSLAPPDLSLTRSVGTDGADSDDDSSHIGLDAATAITANAPLTRSPMTMQVSVVFRNLDALKLGEGDTELALLHEPNVSVQLSPDPNNPVAYQGAISLVNLHLKRNWGLIKPDVEFSLAGQAGFSGGAPNAGLQAQLEVHVSTQISITASSSVGFGPLSPGPPDRGSIPLGGSGVAFTPFMIGIVGHWDPPPAH